MFRSSKRSQRGQILQSMLFGALSLVVVMVLVGIRTFRTQFTNRKLRDDIAQTQLASGIESMVLAYRFAEVKYIQAVADCGTARPFLRALKEGSGCASAPPVAVFTGGDAGTDDRLYQFPSEGCTITPTSSTCANPNRRLIMRIGGPNPQDANNPSDRLNKVSYDIHMIAPEPNKQILQMLAVVKPEKGSRSVGFNNEIAIRTMMPNLAHMELSDGRVTQEHPDPLSKCPGGPWMNFSVYDPVSRTCRPFGTLGGGTGLSYYERRYFGLRPMDGQVVDVLALQSGISSSYMVDENGNIGGQSVFPRHSRSLLVNVDDITVSGNQIQLVSGVGPGAHIGLIGTDGGGTPSRINICPLGTKGWAQSYSGIAGMSWNDPLYPLPTAPGDFRLGLFALKTDGGDLLNAAVIATSGGYDCAVFKDSTLQVVEYKRSGGFDRTNDTLPYYIF